MILLTLTLCTLCINAKTQSYTQQDLDILAQEKNFPEYFEHALDIPPSKRDENWKSQVELMAISYLKSLTKVIRINQKDLDLIKKVGQWPLLSQNEFFRLNRQQFFLGVIKQCFLHESQKKDCLKLTQNLANNYRHETTFAYDLAVLLRNYHIDYVKLWPYIQELANDELSEFYCHKSPMKQIVFTKAQHLYSQGKLTIFTHKDCLKVLKPHLEQELYSKNTVRVNTAYQLLKVNQLLNQEHQRRLSIMRFLQGPVLKKQETHESFSALKEISKRPSERKSILLALAKQSPLPDALFTEKSEHKVAKLRILNRYFPEYLDYYVKTCLDYYQGRRSFPKGSLTPNCRRLFAIDKKAKVLNPNWSRDFHKAISHL